MKNLHDPPTLTNMKVLKCKMLGAEFAHPVQYYAPFTLTTIFLLLALCAFYIDVHLPTLNACR